MTDLTRHTPGPWSVYADRFVHATKPSGAQGIIMAPTYWMEHAPEEAAANARLVAAAPDMFASLSEIKRLILEQAEDTVWFSDIETVVDHIDVLLMRAGGEAK